MDPGDRLLEAVKKNNIKQVLEILEKDEMNIPVDEIVHALNVALEDGKDKQIIYALYRVDPEENIFQIAALHGYLSVLMLINKRYKLPNWVISAAGKNAAEGRHIHVIKYLESLVAKDDFQEFYNRLFVGGAKGGNIPIMDYAIEMGAKNYKTAVYWARQNKEKYKILDYIFSRFSPDDTDLANEVYLSDPKLVEILLENGAPITKQVDEALQYNLTHNIGDKLARDMEIVKLIRKVKLI